jgi:K(+)-stimulated pyrophosphate-energized sodium pump
MNPVIKFTTLFGLLAVELAVEMTRAGQGTLTHILAGVFLFIAMIFVYRSFYSMRIGSNTAHAK